MGRQTLGIWTNAALSGPTTLQRRGSRQIALRLDKPAASAAAIRSQSDHDMAKQLFAPIPLRAMASELSGLQLRVLTCVASHDRLSLINGKGQGCRASNNRMGAMVGCSFARLCTALTKLVELGFLAREKMGRHTVYRVIYNEDDMLLFGNVSAAMKSYRSANVHHATGCRSNNQSGQNLPKSAAEYISLNEEKNSEESGEDSSSEEARFAARRLAKTGFGDNPGGQMARLERAVSVGEVIECAEWFDHLMDYSLDDDPKVSRRAARLLDELES